MTLAYRSMSIRAQIMVLALAILLPVAGMLTWFLFDDLKFAREGAHAKVEILASHAAVILGRQLRQAEDILGRLAVRPMVKALDPRKCDPIVAEYVRLNPEFVQLGLRDLQGYIVCSFLPNPVRQLNSRDHPWFGEGLRAGRFTASDAHLGRASGRWVSVLTHPLRDDAGTVIGLLVLPIDLLKLGAQALESVPKNAVVTVIDRKGTVLLRSAAAESHLGKPPLAPSGAATQAIREGVLSAAGPDGSQNLYTFLTIPEFGWRVVAAVPQAEAYAHYYATLQRTLVIGFGVLLIALALAWWLGAAIVRPIANLAGTAARVAAGDYATRVNAAGPLEIKAVSQQFNRMLDARDTSEAALRESEENLAITLQSIGDAVIATDPGGLVTRMNPAAERLTGWTLAQAAGRPLTSVFRIINSQTRAPVTDPVSQVLAQGEIVSLANHTALLARDGKEYQISDSAAPIRDRAGRIVGVVMVFIDVTEQYRVRQALRDSERRMRAIIDTEPECVKVVDRSGRLREMNAAGLAMLEADSLEEVQQRTLLDFLVPQYRGAFGALHRRVMAGETGVLEFEVVGLKGTRRWLETHAAPMRDAAGNVDMLLGVTRDITARKRFDQERTFLEAQLRESQKMEAIGTLAGGIAHDFNNIIGTILGNADMARQDAGADPRLIESLEEIRKAGHRARDLVQQILSFSRRQPTTRRAIDLEIIVADAVRLLRSTLPARVQIHWNVAADAALIMADATQVQQVLLNLSANAAQATGGRPGRIDIGVESVALDAAAARLLSKDLQPGAYVRISVSDDGDGMDEPTLARIFEPFFTTKTVDEGTGLGLAVVHGIVRSHEGAIAVQSEPGKGSRFDIYFPAAHGLVAAAGAAAVPPLPAEGRGQQVLYIDDDEALVFLVTRLLQRRGYRVSGHVDQNEALAVLKADPARFHLVVTDYNMPGMSGLDVARAVREIRPDLPVAIASGFITDELRAESAQAGVSNLIFKANAVEEFCDVVQRLVLTSAG